MIEANVGAIGELDGLPPSARDAPSAWIECARDTGPPMAIDEKDGPINTSDALSD